MAGYSVRSASAGSILSARLDERLAERDPGDRPECRRQNDPPVDPWEHTDDLATAKNRQATRWQNSQPATHQAGRG